MSGALILSAFLLGAIVGSFLNVVILRFHTGRSLSGFSHCLSCNTRLTALDLVPLVSFLALRGRCRHCGARFSSRYLFVELLTASLFALVGAASPDLISGIIGLLIICVLIVVLVYDLDHLIIPNELVIALVPLSLVFISWDPAQGRFTIPDWSHLVAAFAAFIFFFGLWKVSGGRWIGLGDAKLLIPLALSVGIAGVFSLIVLSFWIGAIASVGILGLEQLLKRGQSRLRFLGKPLTMKSEIPFAPFLIASYLVVVYGKADVLALFDALTSHIFY